MIDELRDEVELTERHLAILGEVIDDEPIGITRLSRRTDYPMHKVRYSLRILEGEDLIEPTQEGAVTTDRTLGLLSDYADEIDDLIDRLSELETEHTLAAEA